MQATSAQTPKHGVDGLVAKVEAVGVQRTPALHPGQATSQRLKPLRRSRHVCSLFVLIGTPQAGGVKRRGVGGGRIHRRRDLSPAAPDHSTAASTASTAFP